MKATVTHTLVLALSMASQILRNAGSPSIHGVILFPSRVGYVPTFTNGAPAACPTAPEFRLTFMRLCYVLTQRAAGAVAFRFVLRLLYPPRCALRSVARHLPLGAQLTTVVSDM